MASLAARAGTAADRRRLFLTGCALAAAATVIFLVWMIFGVGGAQVTDAVDDVGELLAAVVAAVVCGAAARQAPSGRASWALLAASSVAWAAGEAVWCYYDLIRAVSVPFPSLADVGFLSAVPLACAALVLFPGALRRPAHRVLGLLDGCVVATAMLFASWATILGPLYRAHHGGPFKLALSLAYPLGDVVMLSLVVIVITRAGAQHRVSLALVMTGIVAFAVADSAFSYLTEVTSYGNGSILDSGWVAGYLLIALGALRAATAPAPAAPRVGTASATSQVAPYAPVLVVLAVTAVDLMRGRHVEPVTWVMALVLVLLVLVRELVRLEDKARDARARRRAVPEYPNVDTGGGGVVGAELVRR